MADLINQANSRGYKVLSHKEMQAAIDALRNSLESEIFAKGVGGKIGDCVLNELQKKLSNKEICYLILGKDGETHHPSQVQVVRDRATKMG